VAKEKVKNKSSKTISEGSKLARYIISKIRSFKEGAKK